VIDGKLESRYSIGDSMNKDDGLIAKHLLTRFSSPKTGILAQISSFQLFCQSHSPCLMDIVAEISRE